MDNMIGKISFSPVKLGDVTHWDGRIVPGFGSASKQTIDIGCVKTAIIKAMDALLALKSEDPPIIVALAELMDLHSKLNATPS